MSHFVNWPQGARISCQAVVVPLWGEIEIGLWAFADAQGRDVLEIVASPYVSVTKSRDQGQFRIYKVFGKTPETARVEAVTDSFAVWDWIDVVVHHPDAAAPTNKKPDVDMSGFPGPASMKPASWQFLLSYTKKTEWPVFHMYDNRQTKDGSNDVTCGIGFSLPSAAAATSAEIKPLFFDPATKLPATDAQLTADWNAAANLLRTGSNLEDASENGYAGRCRLRMYPQKVYEHMAKLLRVDKYDALMRLHPDMDDFANFPAPAQIALLSMSYTHIPGDFSMMRSAIRAGNWKQAAPQSHISRLSPDKDEGHRKMFLQAQEIVDNNRSLDELPNIPV